MSRAEKLQVIIDGINRLADAVAVGGRKMQQCCCSIDD